MHAGGSGVRFYHGPDLKLFILVGWGRRSSSVIRFYFRFLVVLFDSPGIFRCHTIRCIRRVLVVIFVIYLFYRDDSLPSQGFALQTKQNDLMF